MRDVRCYILTSMTGYTPLLTVDIDGSFRMSIQRATTLLSADVP